MDPLTGVARGDVRFTPHSRPISGPVLMSVYDPKRTLERVLEPELSDAGLLGVIWLADRVPLAAAGRGQFSDVRRLPIGVGEDSGELDQVHPPLSGPI